MQLLPPSRTQLIHGAIYITLCYLSLAILSACAKMALETVSVLTVLFFQNVICFLWNFPAAYRAGFKTSHPYLHAVRDASGFVAYFLFILSVSHISLANAVLLSNSSPLWIPFVVWIWFKKKVPLYLWGAMIVGFIGIIFVLKPTAQIADSWAIFALISGMFIAIAMVCIRRLTQTEPNPRIIFYYSLLGTVVSLPGAISDFSLIFATPTFYYLLGSGITFYLCQFFVTHAFRKAKASTLSPLAYTVVLFSAILDWIFWHHMPDLWSFIGMVLVIGGGIAAVYFERKYESKYV